MTTTARDSMWGPTFPELVEALPGIEIIDRSSVNAFDDARVARAIEATRRKKLIFAGAVRALLLRFENTPRPLVALRRQDSRRQPEHLALLDQLLAAFDPLFERGGDPTTPEDVQTEIVNEIESARWAEVVPLPDDVDAEFGELEAQERSELSPARQLVTPRSQFWKGISPRQAKVARNTTGCRTWPVTCSPHRSMVEHLHGEDIFEEAFERVLDQGVMLPVADRLGAVSTQAGDDRLAIVVQRADPSLTP